MPNIFQWIMTPGQVPLVEADGGKEQTLPEAGQGAAGAGDRSIFSAHGFFWHRRGRWGDSAR